MKGVQVCLADGEALYVADATLEDVKSLLSKRSLVRVGEQFVNASLVTRLRMEEIPSIITPEFLEAS